MADCPHENFTAHVDVNRFEDRPGVFLAELHIDCADCGRAMQFFGMPMGLFWDRPAMNTNGCEVRLPMRPFVKPEWLPEEAHRLMTS